MRQMPLHSPLNFAVLLLAISLREPSSFAQTKGAITGRVLSDDGGGLADVTLVAREVGGRSDASYTTTTDADGNFRLGDLPLRFYMLFVTGSREYVQASQIDSDTGEWRYYRPGENVALQMTRGGVIAGRVTTMTGEPVIGLPVNAVRVREVDGKRVRIPYQGRGRYTDDLGAYRIFGLHSGVYVVEAGGGAGFTRIVTRYDRDIPIYYPSSTRDVAAEVMVAAGGELTGIDIRYRSEPGYVVSGVVTGLDETSSRFVPAIRLQYAGTGVTVALTNSNRAPRGGGFEFHAVPDGEFEASGSLYDAKGDGMRSPLKRISVKGANVTGVKLEMLPGARVVGKVTLEPAAKHCDAKPGPAVEELLIRLRRENLENGPQPRQIWRYSADLAPDEKGEFIARALEPGRYRITSLLPDQNWFLKSVMVSQTPAARGGKTTAPLNLSRSPFLLKPGEKSEVVIVSVAEGAAGLRGRLDAIRAPTIVHLVPAETETGDDVLRYAETAAGRDGSFEFKQLAPGRYWLTVRTVRDEELEDRLLSPAAWNSVERIKLRKEAAAQNQEIELRPCQRVANVVLTAP